MNNQTSSLEFSHIPVMLNEVLKISSPTNGGKFIDCTFGAGGYSKEILKFPTTTVKAITETKKHHPLQYNLKKNFQIDLNFTE